MIRAPLVILALVFASVVSAQQAPSDQPPPAQPSPAAGLENPWEIAPVLQEISAHAGRILAELDRSDPKQWIEKGASETYAEQLQTSKVQAKALQDGALALSRNPEQLAAALVVFFRIQSLDTILASVQEALRKYQSTAEAQSLAGLEAESGANRDRLQRYVVNLASDRERQLKITDQEAQRCRAALTALPTAASKPGKKK